MIFPLKNELKAADITTESAMLLAAVVLFAAILRLYQVNGKGRHWPLAFAGIILYLIGTVLDLLDEFFRLPAVIPDVVENGLIAAGIMIFSLGIVLLVDYLIKLSNVDHLTGIFNKQYFTKVLSQEIERAKRFGLSFSVLFIDLNNFKAINDRLGHNVGDAVLRGVAGKLKDKIRLIDVLARYGGDEFVVLMPQTDKAGAEILLRRLRSDIALPGGHKIGVSIGLAVFPDDGDTADQLIHLADSRMYANKTNARRPV